MNKALENAIYYIQVPSNNNNLKYNIIANFSCDRTKDSFVKIIRSLRFDISIKNFFKNFDNVFYDITDGIARNYDRLLINNVDLLIIVTREDSAIRIDIGNDNNEENHESTTAGIIKIDSVLSELMIANNQNKEGWSKYPIIMFFLGILFGSYLYSDEFFIDYMPKSD